MTSSVTDLSELRKICVTSSYSKILEGFLKEWIVSDIWDKIDPSQFCGVKGTGTEHMLVRLVDRVKMLLDRHPNKSSVIAVAVDFVSAFDKIDGTVAISKLISLGLRPSLVPIMIDYLSERTMTVKFNEAVSSVHHLIGGTGQGTLLAQIIYTATNSDAAVSDTVREDR